MAHRGECVSSYWRWQTERQFVLLGQLEGKISPTTRPLGSLRAAICDQRNVKQTGLYSCNRMPNVRFERRSAYVRRVCVFGPESKVFCQHEIRRPGPVPGAKKRI